MIPSRDIRVCGVIGPAASLEKKSAHVSENSVGVGGTSLWRLCGLVPDTNLMITFDITASAVSAKCAPASHWESGGDVI